jgi:Dolichyl-phosphate-mannose-protein mannosyltransferase
VATTIAREMRRAVPIAKQKYLAYENRMGEFLLVGILVPTTLVAIWLSWRWPLILDGPLFQYCAFLIDHGKVPYRDIVDMNGMGAYFSSLLEIHLFGYSDLGWRLYDLLFLLLGSWGIALVSKPFGKLAAILGSCLLILTHLILGPREIGERDFQMAVLALLSAGFMLEGFRSSKRGWFLASGLMAFLGGTVKPPGFLFLAVFVAQAITVGWRQENKELTGALWMIFGATLPLLSACAYLLWNGAWWPFVEVCRKLIPLYSSIRHRSPFFLRFVLESHVECLRLLIVASGLLLVCKLRNWLTRESITVLLGVGCGFTCYWIQAKGFAYHLDPLIAFLAAWCGLAIGTLLKDDRSLVRLPLAIALALWITSWLPWFVRIPAAYRLAYNIRTPEEITEIHRLEARISGLRAGGKDKGIQFMDTSSGAAQALYDLRLVQDSEFLYDYFFYNFPNEPFVNDLRARFLRKMTATKPDLLVVASQSWPDPEPRYQRIGQWPELQSFLQSNYELKVELSDFRIYVHR